MFLFAVFNMLSISMFLFLFCVVKAFSCFRFACFSLSVWCCWLFPRQDHPKFNTFPPRLSRINGISQFLSNFEFLHRVRIVSDVFKSTLVWSYMQKTCDGGEGYFGQKKIAKKVRKSRQNANRDKSA